MCRYSVKSYKRTKKPNLPNFYLCFYISVWRLPAVFQFIATYRGTYVRPLRSLWQQFSLNTRSLNCHHSVFHYRHCKNFNFDLQINERSCEFHYYFYQLLTFMSAYPYLQDFSCYWRELRTLLVVKDTSTYGHIQ